MFDQLASCSDGNTPLPTTTTRVTSLRSRSPGVAPVATRPWPMPVTQNYTLATFQPKDVCVPKGLDNTDNGRVTAAWRGQNYTLAKFQPKDVCVPKGFDNRANGRVTAAFHYVTAFFCWAVTRCDNCLENEEQSVRLVLSGRHKGPSG